MKKNILVIIILVLILCAEINAQSFPLHIDIQGDSLFFKNEIKYKNKYNTPAEMQKTLTQLLLDLYDYGYLAATFESIKTDSAGTKVVLQTGKKYKWAYLKKGNLDEGWLSNIGYRDRLYSDKPFQYRQVNNLLEKILNYAENNGYPFAQVKLDSIQIKDDKISAQIFLEKEHFITWDTLEISGDSSISYSFLSAYLNVKPGTPYSEAQAKRMESRLKELIYLKITSRPRVAFIKTKAIPQLWVEEQQASRFTGILGLAPNSSKQNKFLVTGDLELEVLNLGGRGISLGGGYKSFLAGAKQINLKTVYPYIFSTQFGLGENFNMTYFDTAYQIISNQFGVNYYFSGNNSIKIFIENYITRLTQPETYAELKITPPFLDISTTWYGIGMNKEKLDFKLNPRRGYTFLFEGSAGIKNITKNTQLEQGLYDSLTLHKIIYKMKTEGSAFTPIGGRSVLGFIVQASMLVDNQAFENQMFRIGGLRTLRGFDEESIFTSAYVIPRIEYRFLPDETSYLQVFTNAAYYQKRLRNKFSEDIPVGFGAGYNYLTKMGMFSVIFAVGKQHNNSFDFNAAKIHVGYLSSF